MDVRFRPPISTGIHIQTKSKASDKGGPERPPLTRALLSAMPSPRRVGMRHPWRLLPLWKPPVSTALTAKA
ncbi:hypothetical protein CEQ28_020275 [Hafnia alvei]|nr:hypothetical protein CEQ28_020275 [Hafnia alvei]